MPAPGGFAGAPTVAVAAVSSPQPGVQVTCTALDASAVAITVYRSSVTGTFVVRGADHAVASGAFTVTDFEAPIGEVLSYTAETYDAAGVTSDLGGPANITLTSARAWLSDPLDPTQATPVYVKSAEERVRAVDSVMLLPIGASAPIMVSGVRQTGAGTIVLTTVTLADTRTLRGITDGPVLLFRAPTTTWDLGTLFLGVGTIREDRRGKLAEGTRDFSLDYVVVQRPSPTIAAPLYTWDVLAQTGKTWGQVLASGRTWLTLQTLGPP